MKQVIPFSKEIVFKTVVASITSISLEHEEKVYDSEVSGDFIIFGDYKVHNDTTEKELFKYRLPFTAILPENAIKGSIKIEIEDFTYDQVEEDVIKVNIDFSISYEEKIDEIPENSEKDRKDLDNNINNEVIDGTNKIDEDTIKEIEEFLKNKEEEKNEKQEDMREEILEKKELEEIMIEDKNEEDIVINDKEERKMINIETETSEVLESKVEEEKSEEIKETINEEYVIYHIHIVKENETIEQIISHYETSMETVKLYNEIDKIKTGDKLIIPEYIDD